MAIAPTLSGSSTFATLTEASSAKNSGETSGVAPFSGVTVTDQDPSTPGLINGAVIRISSNFQSGTTHQDYLRINGTTSGTIAGSNISYSYDGATGTMVLSGSATPAQYKAAIELVRLSVSGDDVTAFGSANSRQIAVSVSDGGAAGTEIFANVTVVGINDAPVNSGTSPSGSAFVEDATDVPLTGFSVSDVDANPATQNIRVTFMITHGILDIRTDVPGGITAANIVGGADESGSIVVVATQNQINATLAAAAGLTFTPPADFNGIPSFAIITNDQGFNGNDPGATGSGTTEQDADGWAFLVSAINDPVTATAPASVTLDEDSVNVAIAGISISDVDASYAPSGVYAVTLSATNGTMTLTTLTGLTFTVNDGTDDAMMTFHGTLADINAALATAKYTPAANYNGSAEITVQVTDTFGGMVATGTGAATSDTDVISVTVNPVADDLVGDSGNNSIAGTPQPDIFRMQQGGDDTVSGLASDDEFYFGGALTSADVVDGGANYDTLVLQGDYGGGLLLTGNVTGIESFTILAGSNTSYGDPGTHFYDYSITLTDASFASAESDYVTIDGAKLRVGEDLTFDASAKTDVNFLVFAGNGTDTLTGGSGDDLFVFGPSGQFGMSDAIDGGAGNDGLVLRGDYTIDFGIGFAAAFEAIENLTLISSSDDRFGGGGGSEFDYDLTWDDGLLGAGQTITVDGGLLQAGETMSFDGSSESDGSFVILGGAGTDVITGGGGNDILAGGLNADTLTGGAGNDTFRYYSAEESTSAARDGIQDFASGDVIDLSRIDADTGTDGDQAFRFIGNAAFSHAAGELRFENVGGPIWLVQGDTDGDGVSDFETVVVAADASPITSSDFLLTDDGEDAPANAEDDAFTNDGFHALSGNLFDDNGSGADSDPDGPPLSISAVNGNAADVGVRITLASGAHLTVNGDGTFSYEPNSSTQVPPTNDSFSYTLAGGDTATVSLTIQNDGAIIGNGGNNRLIGGDDNDAIYGLDGADYITGSFGDDLIAGGNGSDRAGWYQIDPAQGGVTVSLLLQGQSQNTGAQGWDTLTGIENLSGTPFADSLTGDDNANWLWGSPATINGVGVSTENNDYLDGRGGDDLLTVGIGNHTIIGGSGSDTLRFTENGSAEPGIFVQLFEQGVAQQTGAGNWTISGIENLSGGGSDDDLEGDDNDNVIAGDLGSDILFGFGGNDTLLGDGYVNVDSDLHITTVLDQGAEGGNDQLFGGAGNDTLYGGAGNDTLRGNADNDVQYGGSGNDLIVGGFGDDLIDGGDGYDRAGNYHTDETLGGVTIDLNISVAQNTGSQGWDTFVGIEYVSGTPFADTLTGDANDNILWGSTATIDPATNFVSTSNDDTLDGGGGNDLLYVGIGNHSLTGGSGIDTVGFTENFGDDPKIHVSLMLQGVAQDTGQGLWTLDGIENLSGGDDDDELTGDGNANILAGSFGNDTLTGNGGDDTLYGDGLFDSASPSTGYPTLFPDVGANGDDTLEGGEGNDMLDGGGGSDTASYEHNIGAVVVNLQFAFADEYDATGATYLSTDSLVGIENAVGSGFSDSIVGNGSDNILTGLAGNDTIFGRAGNDILDGGSGNDVLRGELGDDALYGGDGNDNLRGGAGLDYFDGGSNTEDLNPTSSYGDRISFYDPTATQGVVADLRSGVISNDGFGNIETMVGIESLGADTAYVDTFYGNDARNALLGGYGDYLYGFGGDDLISNSAAAAVVDGGDGLDLLQLDSSGGWLTPDADSDGLAETAGAATSGWTVDLSTGMVVDGYGNIGAVLNVENITGSALADSITGDANNNVLDGGDGDDTLEGGLGYDQLFGGGGNDTASYASAGSGIQAFLYEGGVGEAIGPEGYDELTDIENLTGSAFDDQLGGNSLDNILDGGDGHDGLRGNAGNDTLLGGNGDDFLNGGQGNDTLDGGAGIDRVSFFNGATAGVTVNLTLQNVSQDTGQGLDTLIGIENVSGTSFNDILTGDDNANVLWGSPATLGDGSISAANNDTLYGGGGNDLLIAGIGNHSLSGGSGTDTVAFTENGGTEPGLTISLALQGAGQTTGAGFWTLNGIENLSGGLSDDQLTGDGNGNILAGNSGNDTLTGGGGDDSLYGDGQINWDTHGTGGSGPITTFTDVGTIGGVSGNDILEGGAGNDLLDGGGGTDTASYAGNSGLVDVNLQFGFADEYDATGTIYFNTDTLVSIENVIGSAFGDSINGNGGENALDGLGGNDFIQGQGGNDTIYGGDGDDTLRGDAGENSLAVSGDDIVYGGNGNDGLRGGLGNDQLYGGANNDLLRGNGGVDYFDGGSDDGAGFNGIGDRVSFFEQRATQGAVADLRTGVISNDGFGNVETMVGIESLGADTAFIDTFYGNDERNFLGASRGDYLYGFGGDDSFQMGAAVAVVDGGTGIDTLGLDSTGGWLTPDSNGDGLAESAAAATAGWTVNLAAGSLLDGYGNAGLVAGIENVNGSQLGDALTGDANANVLNGFDGNDTLNGGEGNDTLDGGAGTDTASYINAGGAVTIDLGAEAAAGADGDDILISIENATGSAFNDQLLGDGLANVLAGGGGHDSLRGLGGNDSLLGGAGDDFLNGGQGDDSIDGGDGFDRAAFAAGAVAGVTVSLSIVGAQNTGQGMDTLVNIEHLSGTGFNDSLTGNNGDNWLWGQGGNDVLTGNGGNDLVQAGAAGNVTASGGSGIDTFSVNDNGGGSPGLTVSLALQGAAQASGIGSYTLSGFENVSGSSGNDILTGDGGANVLAGDQGNDTLVGGGGSDTLYGDGQIGVDTHGAGTSGPITTFADVGILGGIAGNDQLEGGLGNDTLNGGGGIDTAIYANAGGAVVVNLTTGTATGADGTDTLISIENVTGSAFNDQLTGNAGDNLITASNGNDVLNGRTGNDTLAGGNGIDTATYADAIGGVTVDLGTGSASGADGNDALSSIENVNGSQFADSIAGDAGANQLNGGNGDDVLNGRAGNDGLVGGNGIDTASYANAGGAVTVNLNTGNASGADGADTLSSIENAVGSQFADTLTGDANANLLNAGDGNDIILGGRGDDSIYGGRGNDIMSGNQGVDRFVIEANSGTDHVTDFALGIDKVVFSGIAGVDDFSDLTITKSGSNTLITWGTGDSLILDAIRSTQLQASDFQFGSAASFTAQQQIVAKESLAPSSDDHMAFDAQSPAFEATLDGGLTHMQAYELV